jgi:flagellar basal body-associated protein FliL
MKTLSIILAVLLVIVALLGVGLQMFLTKGLTTALNQGVFPAVKSMYGLDMSITNASVNLLKGEAQLEGFQVRNLKGYEEPYLMTFDACVLELEMMSLLKRDPIVIKRAETSGATLIIERNKEKKYNVKELADALKPVESAEPSKTPKEEPAPAPEKAEPVPVHIRRVAVDANVIYIDSGRNREIPLNLTLRGSDLFTVPAEGQPDSLLVLRGSLADDDNAFVTDLNAIVEPLTDPANPSFNATGSILDIDAEFLEELLSKNDMSSGPFSIKPSITCKEGKLEGSQVDLTLTNLEIYETDIGDTTLPLPIGGTLKSPKVNLTAALQELFSKQSSDIIRAIGRKQLQKELGISSGDPNDMLLQGLTNSVKEINESPELQKLIKQVAPKGTNSASTNQATAGQCTV